MPRRDQPISPKLHALIEDMRKKAEEAVGLLILVRPLMRQRGPLTLAQADLLHRAIDEATDLLIKSDSEWWEVRHVQREAEGAAIAPLFKQ